jgi:hypothetical protein
MADILYLLYQTQSDLARACAHSLGQQPGSYVLAVVHTLSKDELVQVRHPESTEWWQPRAVAELTNARAWAAKEGFTRLKDLDTAISILQGDY